jgi:hypothetical protein
MTFTTEGGNMFTDENIKRLKVSIRDMKPLYAEYYTALLTRLEAAEAVCQSVIDNGDELNFKFSMKAWRKVAGK